MKFLKKLFNLLNDDDFDNKYNLQQLILINLSYLSATDRGNPRREEYQKTDKIAYEKIKALIEKMQKESIKEEEKFRLINHSLIYLLRSELDSDKNRKNDYLLKAIDLLWNKMICWDWHLDCEGWLHNLKLIKQEFNFYEKLNKNDEKLIVSQQADQLLGKILATLEKDSKYQDQKEIKEIVFRMGLINHRINHIFINHLKNKLIKESILIDSIKFMKSHKIETEHDFKIFDAYWEGLIITNNLNKPGKNHKIKL